MIGSDVMIIPGLNGRGAPEAPVVQFSIFVVGLLLDWEQ